MICEGTVTTKGGDVLRVEMDPRYRVEFICPNCGNEFQITCPDSVERCICGEKLERVS
jgi:predicted RNA-binding Zn-ribbon protein involved in translation (DUF1610 family)